MSWNAVRQAREEQAESGLVRNGILRLMRAGDKARITIIGDPEVDKRQKRSGQGTYTVVLFRCLLPHATEEVTLELFPHQTTALESLQETHPSQAWDYVVEAVADGTDRQGNPRVRITAEAVPRTPESEAAAQDADGAEVPF